MFLFSLLLIGVIFLITILMMGEYGLYGYRKCR